MKKIFSVVLSILIALTMTINVSDISEASGIIDTKAPILNSINLTSNSVMAGETIDVIGDVTDDISGVSSFSVWFKGVNDKDVIIFLGKNESDGKWKGQIKTTEYAYGTYNLYRIEITDKAENRNVLYKESFPESIKDLKYEVINESPAIDDTLPYITSLQLSKDTINAGETIDVIADVADDVSGVSSCSVWFKCLNDKDEIIFLGKNESDGKWKGQIKTTEYAYGIYSLYRIELNDKAENKNVLYKESFPESIKDLKYEVNNSLADSTPPTIEDISLEFDSVEAPGIIEITADVRDDMSGGIFM